MPSSTVTESHFLRLLCEAADANKNENLLRRWIPYSELKIDDKALGSRLRSVCSSTAPVPVNLPMFRVSTANNSSTYWFAISATFKLQRNHEYRLNFGGSGNWIYLDRSDESGNLVEPDSIGAPKSLLEMTAWKEMRSIRRKLEKEISPVAVAYGKKQIAKLTLDSAKDYTAKPPTTQALRSLRRQVAVKLRALADASHAIPADSTRGAAAAPETVEVFRHPQSYNAPRTRCKYDPEWILQPWEATGDVQNIERH